MVLKDVKTSAVRQFIKMFNAGLAEKFSVNTIAINGVTFFKVTMLELDDDMLIVRSFDTISSCVPVDDINDMRYTNNSFKTVSLDRIEF